MKIRLGDSSSPLLALFRQLILSWQIRGQRSRRESKGGTHETCWGHVPTWWGGRDFLLSVTRGSTQNIETKIISL